MRNNSPTGQTHQAPQKTPAQNHWQANLRLMVGLLSIWFIVSYLFSIVFVEPLNQFYLGGFPVGFWFAQQGSTYTFIILTLIYALGMDRIDRRHGQDNSQHSPETTE